MVFMSAIEGSTNAVSQLLDRQGAIRFSNPAFAVHPLRLNRVEPGAFDRQEADQNADALPAAFSVAVMLADPGPDGLADVPGSVVPNQGQPPLAHRLQALTAPCQKLSGDRTHRTTVHKARQHLLGHRLRLRRPAHQQAIAGQGFPFGVFRALDLLDQAQRFVRFTPGREPGLLKAAPPGLILKAQNPVGTAHHCLHQPVAALFFRSYAGSGLVIHCLARCHFTLNLLRAVRTASRLTRSGVRPCSKLTSAANSRVHTPLGLPKGGGLWWSSSRKRSACSDGKATTIRWGRLERRWSAASPRELKALITSRTASSSQPRFWAIPVARWPRELASRIWQRRRTKASAERRLASNCSRSLSLRVLTKSGLRIAHGYTTLFSYFRLPVRSEEPTSELQS